MPTEPRRAVGPALIVGAALVASAIAYPRLPATVVTHWDAHGRPNGWSPRLFAVLLVPTLMAFVGAILAIVPPEPTPARRATRTIIGTVTLVGMLAMHLVALGASASLISGPTMPRVVAGLVSLLFIGIGNYMPRVTERNAYVGVRFPWAYASDEVWRRTQRAGGYGMVAVGMVSLVAAILAAGRAFHVLGVATAVYLVALGIYSYRLSRHVR